MFMPRRKKFVFIPFAIVGFVLLVGWVVMLLWNAILPKVVTGVSALTYWQAVGLLVLSKILFSGFKGGGPQGPGKLHFREKWRNMSEDERVKFKEAWRERCKTKSA
ncbi:MAG: hypothetical protein IPN76_18095 [Saprospiraceae bacterium]|nr:hypothetical protein [Saprospiraceae bacterium]